MDIILGEASESESSSTCALCHTIISSSDNDGGGDLEAISICGDCKFLLLEDFETTSPDRRRPVSWRRRRRYDSSESMESMFSHQFSQIINLARQQNDEDGDAARLVTGGSRRWRRVFSDTESDGFDSLYGESESNSNASFRRYRAESISYSAYGGESDASLDGHSLFENDHFGLPNTNIESSGLDSDSDIDPMNAGLFQWNSEEDVSEWDEAEGNTTTLLESSFAAAAQPHGALVSNGANAYINWRRQLLSPEAVGAFPLSIRERTNFEEESLARNHAGDYLDARGFEDLLEHLAENESAKRGAPPASASYINNMPCLTIHEENPDSMACAVCKDSFIVGTVVNQLPCFHLYHPSCILPWLTARNTCPLCRYELPTDDRDYEARKRNYLLLDIHHHDLNGDGDTSLDATATYYEHEHEHEPESESRLHHGHGREEQREVVDANSVRDIPRNRWLFLAAPIVSIVGISLVLWFGNPSAGSSSSSRLCPSGRVPCRRENNHRRWWSFL